MSPRDETFEPSGFVVYLLVAKDDGSVLYVGRSRNVASRIGAHMRDPIKQARPWSVKLLRCEDERAMVDLEAKLIREHAPIWNIAGSPVGDQITQVPPERRLSAEF